MLIEKMNKKQKGFSLVELLAVIGVGGAIIAGALLLLSQVNEKNSINDASKNISAIYANLDQLYREDPTTGLDTATGIAAGIFPSNMKNPNSTTVLNFWNGKVEVSTIGSGAGFRLDYQEVQGGNVCTTIVKNQRKVGWSDIGIAKSSEGTTEPDLTDVNSLTISNIATSCGDDSEKVFIRFERS